MVPAKYNYKNFNDYSVQCILMPDTLPVGDLIFAWRSSSTTIHEEIFL